VFVTSALNGRELFRSLYARGRSARYPGTHTLNGSVVVVQSVRSLVSDLDHDLQ